MHEGVAADGSHLYPALPYVYFSRLTRQDTEDLFAYLKTLKPVRQAPTPNKLDFPLQHPPRPDLLELALSAQAAACGRCDRAAAWRRGEYLVNGLGHCAACHTPKNLLFGDRKDQPLAGGTVDHWFAANLTDGQADGLGSWAPADVEELATGVSRHATAAGSMLEKITSSTSRMTGRRSQGDGDLPESLPPRKAAATEAPRHEQMERGRAVFQAYCESCHSGRAAQDRYPNLVGDTLMMGRDPTTVLRIILKGGAAPVLPPSR